MRREWIEMFSYKSIMPQFRWSPSMRREWIEICCSMFRYQNAEVSLHAEGVD